MSEKKTALKLFEDKKIRTVWDEEKSEWFFSVVDACAVLTEQATARGASTYWAVLKKRLNQEGCELLTNCKQLKLVAEDGKMRLTDVADTEQLLRIIQSIPSPKAEPFKRWLAQVGRERMDEIADPELSIDRALATYLKKAIPVSGSISACGPLRCARSSVMSGRTAVSVRAVSTLF